MVLKALITMTVRVGMIFIIMLSTERGRAGSQDLKTCGTLTNKGGGSSVKGSGRGRARGPYRATIGLP